MMRHVKSRCTFDRIVPLITRHEFSCNLCIVSLLEVLYSVLELFTLRRIPVNITNPFPSKKYNSLFVDVLPNNIFFLLFLY